MGGRGSRIANIIAWEYEKKKKYEEKRKKQKEKEQEEQKRKESKVSNMEIGEEIYILRRKIYGEETRVYQKGKVIGIYPSHFCVEFKCKGEGSYKESFDKTTTRYKKELSKNDCLL